MSQSYGGEDRILSSDPGPSTRNQICEVCDERGHSDETCPLVVKAKYNYEAHRSKATIKFEHETSISAIVTTPGTEIAKQCKKCKKAGIGANKNGRKWNEVCSCSKPSPEIKPIKGFNELNLDENMQLNIVGRSRCGFKVPTPIQRYALPIIIKGFDVMGCAQTGTGKTAAYLIPMIKLVKERGFRKVQVGWDEPQKPEVLIIAPTRELAQQIHEEALKLTLNVRPPFGIKVVYGGAKTKFQRSKIRQGCNILIGTPGRIKHFIDDYTISLENTEFLVLDEADKMIDDGFRSDIDEIVRLTDMPEKEDRQTLMFSATFRSDLQELAAASMREDFRLIEAGVIGSAQPNITQNFEFVETAAQKPSMLNQILLDIQCWNELTFLECSCWKKERNEFNTAAGSDQPNIGLFLLHVLGKCSQEKILIFVETKSKAQQLADSISEHLYRNFRARFMTKKKFKHFYNDGDDQDLIENFGAISFHADKDQYNRETALSLFNRGVYPILVATNVAARGLDIEGVTYVINYDLPMNLSDLGKYQKIDTKALKDREIKERPVRNQFEEYIHRIGRTGRAGKKGESISFFQLDKDRHLAEPFRHMLAEAEQSVPEWLGEIADSEWSIRNARRKKNASERPAPSAVAGLSRGPVAKEWDDSNGPCSDELWKKEP
ncbi:ATP-dependent RNA helicase glh-1-like [Bolinopsis microptera]|uniref:ATP-dependent RNA helicase glh-1-like n=1 Tax=Bolinopsis microptera TaxID=2820187 RepID=UPI003079B1BC